MLIFCYEITSIGIGSINPQRAGVDTTTTTQLYQFENNRSIPVRLDDFCGFDAQAIFAWLEYVSDLGFGSTKIDGDIWRCAIRFLANELFHSSVSSF